MPLASVVSHWLAGWGTPTPLVVSVAVGGHRLGPLTAAAAAAAAAQTPTPPPPGLLPPPALVLVAVGTATTVPPTPSPPTAGWRPATGHFTPTSVVSIPGATAEVTPPHP